uniref:Pectate lyase n=1 Tax=viral metagenome TaxID=1070528 RepID=A0A6H1ZP21_9ZZZZ
MRLQSFHQDFKNYLYQQGIPLMGAGNVFWVLKNGTQSKTALSRLVSPGFYSPTIADVNTRLNSLQNDIVVITPESHSLGASLTISANGTHWVGADVPKRMNQRTRIGMSTAFSPMITVSGYGNSFHNLYTMHGTAAADYIGWRITGARNAFYNCHFGGPMNALQGGHASYEGVSIEGSECYFKDCVFGTDTIGRDEASPNVTLGVGTLTVFDNCTFLCNLTDGDPLFFSVENTSGYTWAQFRNCMFMAFNSNYATAMTKAFEMTGGASCAMVFDPLCVFQNVTALSDATDDTFIWYPVTFSTTTDTAAMLSVKLAV